MTIKEAKTKKELLDAIVDALQTAYRYDDELGKVVADEDHVEAIKKEAFDMAERRGWIR